MDERKLDTLDILALMGEGVYARKVPKQDIPKDRDDVSLRIVYYEEDALDENALTYENVARIIEDETKAVHVSEYFGIPFLWRVSDNEYRGELLQYGNVTERFTWTNAEEAINWFIDRAERCAGLV